METGGCVDVTDSEASPRMAFQRPKSAPALGEPELFDYAIRSLTRRMRSERDLRRLLAARVDASDVDAVGRVLARLRELRYLSDERFAQDYTRLRQEGQSFGQRRVRQDLQAKGIGKELIATTVERAYAETDEVVLARQFSERKRMTVPTNPKETARVMGRLLRAGFSSTAIWKLLRAWQVPMEEEPSDPEEDRSGG